MEPHVFHSDHTGFRYFQKGDRCLGCEIFDHIRFEVPHNWLRRHLPTLPVALLDRLRDELGIDPR